MADTQKVVINVCYGGFGFSAKATARLAELQGRECYFYRSVGHPLREFERISVEDADKEWICFAFDTPDAIGRFLVGADDWLSLTDEQRRTRNEEYRAHQIDATELPRHDPNVVRVVEDMGDAANGKHSKLKVVEIPAGIEYEISEYDGNEHIAETHRTWY